MQHPGELLARPVAPGVLVILQAARRRRRGVAGDSSILLLFSFDRQRICFVCWDDSSNGLVPLVPPRPLFVRASQEEQQQQVRREERESTRITIRR